jgi:hypothetical protein
VDRQPVPFAWFEKIALLLLAADLEAQGWPLVRLSVAPSVLTERGAVGGTDWARAVKVARDRGRAFQKGEGPERRAAYRAAVVSESERDALRRGLRASLRSWVAVDDAYRYDGIWHDDGGNVDLAAWREGEALIVEAKGAIQRAGAVDWRVASTDTEAVVRRTVGTAELPVARRGILLPDDHGLAPPGRGYVQTLLRAWPAGRPDDARWPIYLVDAEGAITEWTVEGLRRRPN